MNPAKKYRFGIFLPLIFLLLSVFAPPCAASGARETKVYFAAIDGIVGVPLEEYACEVFDKIGKNPRALLVFKINTPGGLVDSMSAIAGAVAEADYPVVMWVAPSGARAASAGAFLVESAHIAVMAPGTNMGAAHPVGAGGGDIGDTEMNRKVTNDLTAKMRAFAQERGRNAAAAESMVSKSASFTAKEALGKKLIDFIAADEGELLSKLNGRTVTVKGKPVTLVISGTEAEHIEMPVRLRLLEIFSRPDIAYMALLAGILLIILEFKSPGGFVMGTTGAVLLLAASYGLRVLPVNLAGVILLAGGIGIIVADLIIGGIGIISAAGIGAMLFGGLILFKAPGGELLRVSPFFMIISTLVTAVIFLFVLRLIYKALKSRPTSGREGMAGGRGVVTGETDGKMMAMIFGEYWRVLPSVTGEKISVGDTVEVVRTEGLNLYVKRAAAEENDSHENKDNANGAQSATEK